MQTFVETGDFRICFDKDTRVASIQVFNGHAEPESFQILTDAIKAMYQETYDKKESIVVEFDVSQMQGMNPTYVYRIGKLFREMRDMSNVILQKSVVKMQTGLALSTIRSFLSLYPLTKPIDIVEMEGTSVKSVETMMATT